LINAWSSSCPSGRIEDEDEDEDERAPKAFRATVLPPVKPEGPIMGAEEEEEEEDEDAPGLVGGPAAAAPPLLFMGPAP
jgi:hypothetical protein